MQKEKTLTQNVNIRTDAHKDRWMDGRTDEQMDGKTKTIYPSTYFVCQGYNNHFSMAICTERDERG